MKKPIIIIALIILLAAGSVGALYATGNLEGVVDKIFNRSEVLDMSDEKNFDEILRRVKENLGEVESVRARKKTKNQWIIGDQKSPEDLASPLDGESEMNFIFVNEKSISNLQSIDVDGKEVEHGTVIIGEDIYRKLFSVWIHGRDGQSIPTPIPDTPGDYLTFNLNEYPEGWDFTKNIEKIEKDLGVEEINGVKCHHYKVRIKKIPVTQENLEKFNQYFFRYIIGFSPSEVTLFKEGDVLELKENHIKHVLNGEEVLVSLPESLTLSPMYLSAEVGGNKIETWAIEGEIWVGQDNFLVYRENYTEESSHFYYDVDESGEVSLSLLSSVFKNDVEIVYSDFNSDIKIEAPTENVKTVEDFLSEMIYPIEREKEDSARIKAMDSKRKGDLLNLIHGALEKYYEENNHYPVNKGLEKTNDKNCVLWNVFDPIEIPIDPLNPEFYYTYKSDGQSYELVARLENLEDENCVIENDICLYKCKDGVCGK